MIPMIWYPQMDFATNLRYSYGKSSHFTSRSKSESQNSESRSTTHSKARTPQKPSTRQKRGNFLVV